LSANEFIEVSGYLRVLENKILKTDTMEIVLNVATPQDALKQLSQNSIYDFTALNDVEEYESVLDDSLASLYSEMYALAGESKIVELAAAKYDYHNVKVAVKSKCLGETQNHLLMRFTQVSPETICEYAQYGKKADELPEHICVAVCAATHAFEVSKKPQDIDLAADINMYCHMLDICKELGIEFATDYVRESIDYFNLKAFLRVRDMQKGLRFLRDITIPGGLVDPSLFAQYYDRTLDELADKLYYQHFGDIVKNAIENCGPNETFSDLERRLDNALIQKARSSKYLAYGPELILSYIFARENEMQQIRIIMSGKINNVSTQVLRGRLRENYA